MIIRSNTTIEFEGIRYYLEYEDVHVFDEETVIVSDLRLWYYNGDEKEELVGEKHRLLITRLEEAIGRSYLKDFNETA